MLDRQTPAVAALTGAPSLARRRALVAVTAGVTIGAVLWLAATAVPPRSASAIAFLALFAATLPWSTIGFWNAWIGFLIMCFSRDPVATVNPMAAHIRGDEPIITSHGVRPHRLSIPSFYLAAWLCMEQPNARKSHGSLVSSLGKALAADSYRLRRHRYHCNEGAWRHRLCGGNRRRPRFVRTRRGSDRFPRGRGPIRANWRRSHPRGS
jgi:hypothetical protein